MCQGEPNAAPSCHHNKQFAHLWFLVLEQLMIGYLIFASASLLGYSGGFVALTALEVRCVCLVML